MGYTYSKYKSLYKYIRVIRSQDIIDLMCIIDLMLVKRDIIQQVQDITTDRGIGRTLSDHPIIPCKGGSVGTIIKRRKVVNRARRIKNKKLRE